MAMTDRTKRGIDVSGFIAGHYARWHERFVFGRRVAVLARHLGERIPDGTSVLDVGCGDGRLARTLMRNNPSLRIEGVEIRRRPTCQIPCATYDGRALPYPDDAYDLCLFVDVLHHTPDIAGLLAEACRVSRRFLLIKDHLWQNRFDFWTLKLMDWAGNRPHGVRLPYHFQRRERWERLFRRHGLTERSRIETLHLYPFPADLLFDRRLHFVTLLEKNVATKTPAES